MLINIERAREIFSDLPSAYQYPTLDPDYVEADCKEKGNAQPIYYFDQNNQGSFYHATHQIKSVINSPILADVVDFESQRGYGGPIVIAKNGSFSESAYARYLGAMKDMNGLVEFIRYIPLIENRINTPIVASFERETVWIDLCRDNLLASYETRARTAIRKAEKNGVISSWATDRESWSLFSKLYSRRMSELNASEEFCFSHDYFIRLMNMHSAHLLLASVDGEVIAGALFLMTDDFMEYHLSASTSEGMRVCATQHLIHTAAEAAAAKRIKYFHLGGGTDNSKENPLLFFKSGFSKNRSEYYTGKWVFDEKIYADLQHQWMTEGKGHKRAIFYR
ncbi:MAG: GNAT family N-acetyltransferase [Pseudomonadales bacterium]|nr:GNAT family N-acetyltransferase [Pseudomonadales bacterium]